MTKNLTEKKIKKNKFFFFSDKAIKAARPSDETQKP